MEKKDIKISVIIRTYNSINFVGKAIDSALSQNFKESFEVLVVDDGSEDGTADFLIKRYKNKIRVIRQKHSGHVQATNKGILESRGKYVILLDADDVFFPQTLKEMFEGAGGNADYIYCDYIEKTKEKEKIVSLKDNIFDGLACGIMFDRKLFDELGLFDKDLIFTEYDFLAKLVGGNKKGKHIPLALYVYNRDEKGLTSNSSFVKKALAQLEKKYGSEIIKKIRKY